MTFSGQCSICGFRGTFEPVNSSPRDCYPCPECRFTLRYRDQAAVILDFFGNGAVESFNKLAAHPSMQEKHIVEFALGGPFIRYLYRLPHYQQAYFFESEEEKQAQQNKVMHVDIMSMPFDDNSLDLIITSDVLEHVPDVSAALNESRRVLKPGGVHVFSIPVRYPIPKENFIRACMREGSIHHIAEPHYHVSGTKGKTLVFTDFGEEIATLAEQAGLRLMISRRSAPIDTCLRNYTFAAIKT
ncbi:class I SAM-dependent methyltransferase [Kordiimonas aestuarii]|uniref:class I SAM-dependent methyltransferase n=1 Tax=Kordiimonas aestuarii TaxID=1005925 RepID=UPI0021D02E3D|nr:class I SAM-dependent methyltransferase [Kordiimonas aestuarii]